MFRHILTSSAVFLMTTGYALAADLADKVESAEGHSGSFLEEATTWVAVAFLLFVAAVARPVGRIVIAALDNRADAIRTELDEAQRLREEAQHTLAEYQRKQRDALSEAEGIIAEAHEESKRMQRATQERTEQTLARREQQALDMIAAAEARALADVRALTADVAIEATRRILTDVVEGQKGDDLINNAIEEVPTKLN